MFPVITNFDHEGFSMVSVVCDLTVAIFELLNINYWDINNSRVRYIERILKGDAVKNPKL